MHLRSAHRTNAISSLIGATDSGVYSLVLALDKRAEAVRKQQRQFESLRERMLALIAVPAADPPPPAPPAAAAAASEGTATASRNCSLTDVEAMLAELSTVSSL